eukprot:Opistho-2@32950
MENAQRKQTELSNATRQTKNENQHSQRTSLVCSAHATMAFDGPNPFLAALTRNARRSSGHAIFPVEGTGADARRRASAKSSSSSTSSSNSPKMSASASAQESAAAATVKDASSLRQVDVEDTSSSSCTCDTMSSRTEAPSDSSSSLISTPESELVDERRRRLVTCSTLVSTTDTQTASISSRSPPGSWSSLTEAVSSSSSSTQTKRLSSFEEGLLFTRHASTARTATRAPTEMPEVPRRFMYSTTAKTATIATLARTGSEFFPHSSATPLADEDPSHAARSVDFPKDARMMRSSIWRWRASLGNT